MASISKLTGCIGLSGNISIIRDFYGYTGIPKPLSLLTQARLLKGSHIHLNLIRVGGTNANGRLADSEEKDIDAAVQFTRDTYATIGVGIGRVNHFFIPPAQVNGHDIIDGGDEEADALTDEWTVPNDGIDVFLVRFLPGPSIGKSPTPGPCDKNAQQTKSDRGTSGVIISFGETFGTPLLTGFTLAHELGHHLGLEHTDDSSNLMFSSSPNPVPSIGKLTDDQGSVIRGHCWMRDPCQA